MNIGAEPGNVKKAANSSRKPWFKQEFGQEIPLAVFGRYFAETANFVLLGQIFIPLSSFWRVSMRGVAWRSKNESISWREPCALPKKTKKYVLRSPGHGAWMWNIGQGAAGSRYRLESFRPGYLQARPIYALWAKHPVGFVMA